MALAIDASTPAPKLVPITGTSVASNTFSPPANSVIALMVVVIGPSGSATSVSSVTDSLGSHLTWGLITGARSNTNSTGNLGGTCEVWYASCPSAQTNMTVTPTYSNPAGAGNAEGFVLPIVFTGAATTQNGAVATDPQTAAALPSKAVTTTRAGSRVIGCALNYTNATGPTAGTAQTNTINGNSTIVTNATDGDAAWGQMQNANTTSSGTVVTINDTAPSCKHNMVVVEILATSSTTFTSTLTTTGVGVVSVVKQAKPVKFVFAAGGIASRSTQVQPVRSATGVGVASVGKVTAKPLTAGAGVGLASLATSKAKLLTLTATGVGIVAALSRQVAKALSATGVGTPSVAKAVSSARAATSGVGVASISRQGQKPLTASGVGLVSIKRAAAGIRTATGVGVATIATKSTSKTRTATGVGVIALLKQPRHIFTTPSGVGVVSIASAVIPVAPVGPQPGFVELFVEPIATGALLVEGLATVELYVESVATANLYLVRIS